jgi:tRNA A37 methylthiotransferase MiaB
VFRIKKIYIDASHVCDRGKIDAQRIATYFNNNDYKIEYNPKKADIIIFNACGYSTNIKDKCLNEIKKYEEKYDAELIVVGGLPETDKSEFEKNFSGRYTSHKELDKIDTFFPENKIKFQDIKDSNIPWITFNESKIISQFKKCFSQISIAKNIYFKTFDYILKNKIGNNYLLLGNPLDIPSDNIFRIRIAHGCNFNCSYCSIVKATGKLQSKPFEKCLEEFKLGLKDGYKKFHIIAVDPGGYGLDIGKTYTQLLETITNIEGNYNIGLEAINPIWLLKYLDEIEEILKRKKINSISVPIQSGSSRILKLMNRYSNVEKINNALLRLKKSYYKLELATACIVGFPSETENEFKETLNFVLKSEINMGVLIPMSIKPGTKAEELVPKISNMEIKERIDYAKYYFKTNGYNTLKTDDGGFFFGIK